MLSLRPRSRLITSTMLGALGAVGATSGCENNCNTFTAQTITVAVQAPLAGSSLVVQGVAQPIVGAPPATEITEGMCSASLSGGSEDDPTLATPEGTPPPAFAQVISIECILGGRIFLWATGIGDVRDAAPGVQALQSFGELVGQLDEDATASFCDLSGTVTLTIHESAGASAPFPVVVTPDYRKVMQLTIDKVVSTPAPSSNGLPQPNLTALCDTLAGFTTSLDFVNTATDIQGSPDGARMECED